MRLLRFLLVELSQGGDQRPILDQRRRGPAGSSAKARRVSGHTTHHPHERRIVPKPKRKSLLGTWTWNLFGTCSWELGASKYLVIRFPDYGSIYPNRFHELSGCAPAAAHRDAVERRIVRGQHGLADKTPSPQNALDAAQLFVSADHCMSIHRSLQCPQRVGLIPAALETKGLRHEFGVHQAADAGLDREMLLAVGCALGLNTMTHPGDLRFPVRRAAF